MEIGAGTYSRERKNTTLRQATTDRDALWGIGIRVPLGNRFCHAGAALTWGNLHDTNVADGVILLSGCYPKPQEEYDTSAPNAKKFETREAARYTGHFSPLRQTTYRNLVSFLRD